MPNPRNLTYVAYRGSTWSNQFSGPNEDLTQLGLAFYLGRGPRASEDPVLTLVKGSGISNVTNDGKFKVTLTRSQTLNIVDETGTWYFEVYDTTNEELIAMGTIEFLDSVRDGP